MHKKLFATRNSNIMNMHEKRKRAYDAVKQVANYGMLNAMPKLKCIKYLLIEAFNAIDCLSFIPYLIAYWIH